MDHCCGQLDFNPIGTLWIVPVGGFLSCSSQPSLIEGHSWGVDPTPPPSNFSRLCGLPIPLNPGPPSAGTSRQTRCRNVQVTSRWPQAYRQFPAEASDRTAPQENPAPHRSLCLHLENKWHFPSTAHWLRWLFNSPGGLPSMGSHRVRHDWSDLAAAAAVIDTWDVNLCPNLQLGESHVTSY